MGRDLSWTQQGKYIIIFLIRSWFSQGLQPLRPFTILPSDAADRARLQAQVFGPGHRLPTMSIDEYLQIERERGNIITGGGYVAPES